MRKALILAMFSTALFFVLRSWYSQPGNGGIPNPRAMVGPVYLYAILALVSDFLGGIPIVLAAGMTVAFIWQAQKVKAPQVTTIKIPPTVSGSGNLNPASAGIRQGSGNPNTQPYSPSGVFTRG